MSEEDLSEFAPKWHDRYTVKWCSLCDCAVIICPECKHTTCNCGGCDSCADDFREFAKSKTRVEDYLTEAEAQTYRKALRIRHFMLETLARGKTEIDWEELDAMGELSTDDRAMFLWV